MLNSIFSTVLFAVISVAIAGCSENSDDTKSQNSAISAGGSGGATSGNGAAGESQGKGAAGEAAGGQATGGQAAGQAAGGQAAGAPGAGGQGAQSCPAEADVQQEAACEGEGLSCKSLLNAYPADCGQYEKATCDCRNGKWSCRGYTIDCHQQPPTCPAPRDVTQEGTCSGEGLSCKALMNAACPWNYIPAECDCRDGKWSCKGYTVDCHAMLSPTCPAEADVRDTEPCGTEPLLCMSQENPYPEACGVTSTTACKCEQGAWKCYRYDATCN